MDWTLTGGASLTHGRFAEDVGRKARRTESLSPSPSPSPIPSPILSTLPMNENLAFSIPGLSQSAVASLASSLANFAAIHGTFRFLFTLKTNSINHVIYSIYYYYSNYI